MRNLIFKETCVIIDDLIYSKEYLTKLSETLTLVDMAKTLNISDYKCKRILNKFNLTPVHNLNSTKRVISIEDDLITYWGNDNKIHKTSRQEILTYYHDENHTDDETNNYFAINISILRTSLKIPSKPRKLTLVHNRETCLKKYGDENYNNVQKNRETCLERYGVENVYQSEEFKKKIRDTHEKDYGSITNYYAHVNEKGQKTCLDRYGVKSPIQVQEFKEKRDKTNIKKYGGKSPMHSEEVKSKYDFKAIADKAFKTKVRHRTTNTSSQEIQLFDVLKSVYGDDNVLFQFNDDLRYPFRCDFYIKSLDLFIELNLYFTHGGHPFNINSKEDISKLNAWREKATKSKFYANAIEVWTVRDVEKLEIAKKNNLNYLTIYSQEELNEFINKLKEKLND